MVSLGPNELNCYLNQNMDEVLCFTWTMDVIIYACCHNLSQTILEQEAKEALVDWKWMVLRNEILGDQFDGLVQERHNSSALAMSFLH